MIDGRILVASLALWAIGPAALASGRRGTVLSAQVIENFAEVKLEQIGSANYVGSTGKWHVFMRVLTSTGGGMPFDHLDTYRVSTDGVTITNSWTITFSDKFIYAANCPRLKKAGDAYSVSADKEARERCGT
jgi:hypothetical protein